MESLISIKVREKMNNMKENRTDKRTPGDKKSKAEIKRFVLALAVILFLPITILMAVEWFTSADAFAIGITGFIQTAIVNGGLGLVAVIIALVFFLQLIQPDTTFIQNVGRTAGIILCLTIAFFLVRPLVLDIPYLKHPEASCLERLEFDYERGIGDYASDDYYLRGVDMTGERHSFPVSKKRYEEGRTLWSENNFSLFAKVTYLPHTSTLMTLELMTELDAAAAELYPASLNSRMIGKVFLFRLMIRFIHYRFPLRPFLMTGG